MLQIQNSPVSVLRVWDFDIVYHFVLRISHLFSHSKYGYNNCIRGVSLWYGHNHLASCNHGG